MTTSRKRAAPGHQEFVQWARERAIFFDPGSQPEPAQLARLDTAVAHKRIAALTSMAPHCTQHDQFRRWLVSYLLAHDFSLIGAGPSWADGARIDRHLRTGDPLALPQLAGDRATSDAQFARFLHGCVPADAIKPHFFGFDVGPHDAGTLAEIVALVAEVPADAMLTNLHNLLTRAPSRTLEQPANDELEHIAWVLEWIDLQFAPLTDRLGGERYQRLVQAITVLHDSLGYHTLMANPATRADAGALRRHMAQNSVACALAELYPRRRAVLLTDPEFAIETDAADQSRDAAAANNTTVAQRAPLHNFVRHTLATNDVFSVWLLHGGGNAGAARGRPASAGKAPGNAARATTRLTIAQTSLNALLAKVGNTFVLPLDDIDDPRAAPLHTRIGIMQADNSVLYCVPADELDAIYFAPSITPPARN